MGWLLLGLAIAAEIGATTALRFSNGFTNLIPTIITVAGYIFAFVMMSRALRTIDLGVAYAVWSAIGTAVIAVIGIYAFGEPGSVSKTLGLALIIGGVVLVNLQGGH